MLPLAFAAFVARSAAASVLLTTAQRLLSAPPSEIWKKSCGTFNGDPDQSDPREPLGEGRQVGGHTHPPTYPPVQRKLMQAAFNPDNGPLTDKKADRGECVGIMDLFSGAIGHCKNPPSHREVGIERQSAAQLIGFASHLLMQVDSILTLRRAGLF